MKIRPEKNPETRNPFDALVLPFFAGDSIYPAHTLTDRLLKLSEKPIAAHDFTAKSGEVTVVWSDEIEKRVLLWGLGAQEACSKESIRKASSELMQALQKTKSRHFSLFLPELPYTDALIEGLLFETFQTKEDPKKPAVEEAVFITHDLDMVLEAKKKVEPVMKAVGFARELIHGNADLITPEYLGQVAENLSDMFARVETKVYDDKWCEENNLGLFNAVAKGSSKPSRFIVMEYNGDPAATDHTVLVGKGITFDTGGLNLKPTGFIENMRKDMSGAAIVLATMQAIAERELPIKVTGVIASCENAIGPDAFKPGDVFTSYNGKTVEIKNTDAEGRLILADALSYSVQNLHPTQIIDIATLTGAIIVALGSDAIGYYSNCDILAKELEDASHKTFERVWRMPLFDGYREKLKSDFADLSNCGSDREAGSSVAASFLQEFVGNIPWAHFDIAGTSYFKERKGYWQKNATAMGVRLLVEFLEAGYTL